MVGGTNREVIGRVGLALALGVASGCYSGLHGAPDGSPQGEDSGDDGVDDDELPPRTVDATAAISGLRKAGHDVTREAGSDGAVYRIVAPKATC